MSKCAVYYCGAWGSGFDAISDDALECLDIFNYSNAEVTPTNVRLNNPEEAKGVASLHRRRPDMPVVLSLVGFYGCTGSDEAISDTAARVAALVREYGFDGVDLDWEFPTESQRHAHTLLLAALRRELGEKYIISAAVPPTEWAFNITELDFSHKYLDYVNIMTYDIYSERSVTSHHSAPHSPPGAPFPCSGLEENLRLFLGRGVPPEKLIGGAAFYSRQWMNVSCAEDGLFVPTDGGADYGPKFCELDDDFVRDGGYTRFWDAAAVAPYLWNGSTFITYDDERSVAEKCAIVKKLGTGGMMAWEFACDTSEHKLLKLMRDRLL